MMSAYVAPAGSFRPIDTPRLHLRPYAEQDAELVHAMMSDPEVMRYYPSLYDLERARALIAWVGKSVESYGYSFWAVERKGDSLYLGHVGVLHWDDVDAREDVEVAYMLRREHWGYGYATEAAQICRDWAFAHTVADRVVSFIDVNNAPSIGVAQRNGMTCLRRLDQNRFDRPVYVYGISRERWTTLTVGESARDWRAAT